MKKRHPCVDCGAGTTKTRCKPCGYSNRQRPSGLKYNIVNENPSWFKKRNSIWEDSKGYLQRYIAGKNVRVHRHIVEQHLGRKLLNIEVVHHINGNKKDNSIENLLVMTKRDHDNLHNGKGVLAI